MTPWYPLLRRGEQEEEVDKERERERDKERERSCFTVHLTRTDFNQASAPRRWINATLVTDEADFPRPFGAVVLRRSGDYDEDEKKNDRNISVE